MSKKRDPASGAARLLRSVLSVLGLLLLWLVFSRIIAAPIILPGPQQVLSSLGSLLATPSFWTMLVATLWRVLLALTISVPLAVAVGILAALRPAIHDLLRPIFALVSATPVLSIILIAFFVFGQEGTPLFTAFLLVFPIVTHAAIGAIQDLDKGLLEVAQIYRLPFWSRLRWLWIPALLPRVVSALRAALGMAWKVVVAAEILVQPLDSLGRGMFNAKMNLETAELFAWTLATVALAAASEALLPLSTRLARSLSALYSRQRGGQPAIHPSSEALLPGELSPARLHAQRPLAPVKAAGLGSGEKISGLVFSGVHCRRTQTQVLRDFSLSIDPGERVVVLGPSACGKTTLLLLAAGLLVPDSGTVEAPATSIVFQEPRLFPGESILENAALPLNGEAEARSRAARSRAARGRALALLDAVGLSGRLSGRPAELSGGQRQRVAIARAFVSRAPLLLMDEPFQSLDLPLRIQLMDLTLSLLERFPRTLLAVTHDPREAIYLADRVIVMGSAGKGIVAEERVQLSKEERSFSSLESARLEARLFEALVEA